MINYFQQLESAKLKRCFLTGLYPIYNKELPGWVEGTMDWKIVAVWRVKKLKK